MTLTWKDVVVVGAVVALVVWWFKRQCGCNVQLLPGVTRSILGGPPVPKRASMCK